MKSKYGMQRACKKSVQLCSVFFLIAAGLAQADMTPLSPDSEYLLGDWRGYRSQLKAQGAEFQLGYTLESAANLAGGDHTATTARYTDQWAFGTRLDLDKLLNLEDTQFQFTLTSRNGQDLTHYINDPRSGGLSSVQEVWGRGQTWRLTQFRVNKGLFNHLVEIKAGRVTTGEDFDAFDSKFENLAFGSGQPGNWRGDRWFNWPVSQWGGRIKFNLPDSLFLQIGFYNQNRNNYDRGNGFYLDGSPSLGDLLPVELGWQPQLGNAQLPGNYRIGAYYSSVNGARYASYHEGSYEDKAHAYGGYLLLQQQITATDGDVSRGVVMTFQSVINDHKTSKTNSYQALALTWKGPFASRPGDEAGLGVARIHVNSDYSRMLKSSNDFHHLSQPRNPLYLPVQHGAEWNYELYYNLRATDWLDLRPNLQYVASPGGVRGVQDAFIGGLSASITF